jgi:7,8-dihydropterin-6-yl-methyl-4-(beta-D-ribofuranosyl)aminobenzene 5'-phosphate synthase
MSQVLPVDRLEVLVLVDNVTDSLSSNPNLAVSEWMALMKAGRLEVLSGRCTCCAHHGLSLLITAHVGGAKHTVLFDTGPEAATFMRNAKILGVDFSEIEAVVLSHGHWDHGAGMIAATEAISKARNRQSVDCFMHPGMFVERAQQLPNGEVLKLESVPATNALADVGANVICTREPQFIAGGAFCVSGEIPRVTPYEIGLPGHVRRGADGQTWEPDPLIMDERFIAVHVKDKGQFIFTACSHAGVVNVLTHARSMFPSVPLYGVMGGFHLAGVTEKIIPDTIADLKQFGLKFLAPGHCTGWRAMSAMTKVFGDELVPSAVGKRYVI